MYKRNAVNALQQKFIFLGRLLYFVTKINFILNSGNKNSNKEFYSMVKYVHELFTVINSNVKFINGIFDNELFELNSLFFIFFDIYRNIRSTNLIKTAYLFETLHKSIDNSLNTFFNRFPSIKKKYIKYNPDNGDLFFEV